MDLLVITPSLNETVNHEMFRQSIALQGISYSGMSIFCAGHISANNS
jgi:hypothetical protein